MHCASPSTPDHALCACACSLCMAPLALALYAWRLSTLLSMHCAPLCTAPLYALRLPLYALRLFTQWTALYAPRLPTHSHAHYAPRASRSLSLSAHCAALYAPRAFLSLCTRLSMHPACSAHCSALCSLQPLRCLPLSHASPLPCLVAHAHSRLPERTATGPTCLYRILAVRALCSVRLPERIRRRVRKRRANEGGARAGSPHSRCSCAGISATFGARHGPKPRSLACTSSASSLGGAHTR